MEDRLIFKIAFATSIIGIVGMIIFSGQITPREVNINEINLGMLDEEVIVEGVADDIKESPNSHSYFIEIVDKTGKINVVVFDKNVKEIQKNNLKIHNLINRRIKVVGTVTEYNGRLELILKDTKSFMVVA
jgi:DNA/RNA endonuclease YhcR with UshA esterase domain